MLLYIVNIVQPSNLSFGHRVLFTKFRY